MSYCRMGKNSDVYLYPDINRGLVCCSCRLGEEIVVSRKLPFMDEERAYIGYPTVKLHTLEDAVEHLVDHESAGHKVPQHAFTRLHYEIEIEKIRRDYEAEIDGLRERIRELEGEGQPWE